MGLCSTKQQRPLKPVLINSQPKLSKKRSQQKSKSEIESKQSTQRTSTTQTQLELNLTLKCSKGNIFDVYSLLKSFKPTGPDQMVIQHNLTGVVRQVHYIQWDGVNVPEYAQWIMNQSFNHPHIIRTHEIYCDNERYYLVQDYPSGLSLKDYLRFNPNTLHKTFVTFMSQILQAMQYIQSKQLFHGSLSLTSFYFTDESKNHTLKLVDIYPLFKKDTRERTLEFKAPEIIIANQPTPESDVWACGMIFLFFFTKHLPYDNQDKKTITQQMKRQKIDFDENAFLRLKDKYKQFLESMLIFDRTRRATILNLLKTSWISDKMKTKESDFKSHMMHLGPKVHINQLQACFLLYMINEYCNEQQTLLMKIFNEIDNDKDQKLTKDELIRAYSKIIPKDEATQYVEHIFDAVDVNNDGSIEFSEFIIAIIDKKSLLTQQRLQEVFKLIDKDHNGEITLSELMQVFNLQSKVIKRLMDEIDQDKNGKVTKISIQINYTEFKDLMTKLI